MGEEEEGAEEEGAEMEGAEEEGAEEEGGCLLPLFPKIVLFQNPNGRTGGTLRCHILRALPLVLGRCVPEATMCCGENWPKG